MKISLSISLFSIVMLLLTSLNASERSKKATISWSEKPLSWHDFRALPDRRHGGALTASAIFYNYGCRNDTVYYEVGAVFFPNESYVNAQVRHAYMLSHEQLHFDITELFARKLRKALSESILECGDRSEIEYLCNQTVEEWHQMQDQYDFETEHSMIRDAQIYWNNLVHEALKELEAWK